MTKRKPFSKLSGTLGYIEVAGCWLVPTTHTIWPSAFVSKINATHEARVKEAVREAMADRDARIAELERVLGEIDKYWFDPASGGACGMCDANLHENAEKKHKQLNGDPCPIQVAHEALAEIKSVLGKGE